MTSTTDTTKEERKPKFTYDECRTIMGILNITQEDLNTMVIIEDFYGYGVLNYDNKYKNETPKITRAASKTGYYSTFEDSYSLSTDVVEDNIIAELSDSLEAHWEIMLPLSSLE